MYPGAQRSKQGQSASSRSYGGGTSLGHSTVTGKTREGDERYLVDSERQESESLQIPCELDDFTPKYGTETTVTGPSPGVH